MPVFPPEILDTIVDGLKIPESDSPRRDWLTSDQENLNALRTLLLVSQDVAIRARHHLFKCVHLSFDPSGESKATYSDERQLELFSDIVNSSVKLRNLGVLPHIRKLFLFCYEPDSDLADTDRDHSDDDSDGVGIDEDLARDGYESRRSDSELTEVETRVAKYWGHLSNILNVLGANAMRIEQFLIDSNDPEGYRNGNITFSFDLRDYSDWNDFPEAVQRSIFNLIHSPRLRGTLKKLTVRTFINVPPDLVAGTDIEKLFLYATPSPGPFTLDCIGSAGEIKDTILAPPLSQLDTLDYILPQVTRLCLGSDQSLSDTKASVNLNNLFLSVPVSDLGESVEVDRFAKLGRTIMNFYPSVKFLACRVMNINPKALEERGIMGMPELPINIQALQHLTEIHVVHFYEDLIFAESWYSASRDPSGPPLRNLISILKHCPKTLVTVVWKMGFDFLKVVGDDLKREMVNEYQELDQLCTRNFPGLRYAVIRFLVGEDDDHPKQAGYPTEDVIEGCKMRLVNALESLSSGKKLVLELE